MSDRTQRFVIEDMLDKGKGAHEIARKLNCPLGKVQFVKRVHGPGVAPSDSRSGIPAFAGRPEGAEHRASGIVSAPQVRRAKAARLYAAATEFKRAHDSGLTPAQVAHLQSLRTRRGLSVAGLVKVTGHSATAICAALGLDAAFARR